MAGVVRRGEGARRRLAALPIDTCVPAIARFCDCKVWLAREPAPPNYVFFGFETDAALSSYLFAVIDRTIRSELEGFRMQRPEPAGTRLRQESSNFQIGMAARVAERLTGIHAEREASVAAQRPTGARPPSPSGGRRRLPRERPQAADDFGPDLSSGSSFPGWRGLRRAGQPRQTRHAWRVCAARGMSGRDGQWSRLYAWEDVVVAPRGRSLIPFARAQGMVDAIWSEKRLLYPPKVERLTKQATARQADATRLSLRLPEQSRSPPGSCCTSWRMR